jgi:hypothetical protein
VPDLASKLTMDEEVVYSLLILFAKTTPINKGKNLPSKVIDREDFAQRCRLSEESIARWSLHFPNTLSWKLRRLSKL